MQSAEPSPATPVGDKTIADYLVERIADYGVRHVFGIPGDYCIVLWERMHQSGLIQTVNTCDEQGSGFAGDAYARMRGLGVVCQTYGVGGFKSIHAAAQAYAERSPLLIISGAPGLRERARGKLLHHLVDGFYTQLETFEKVTVASAIIEDPNTAFAEIDRVLSAALRHRRPVYLEIPRDLSTAGQGQGYGAADAKR